MFLTYILYSHSRDRYYVGSTADIESRLIRHNSNQVKSTKDKGPWICVYTEQFETRAEASNREQYIKQQKSRKYILSLIEKK